jgi:hypothetical protein
VGQTQLRNSFGDCWKENRRAGQARTDLCVHCETTELSALTLDELLGIYTKAAPFEERPGSQTCLGKNLRHTRGAEGGFNVPIKPHRDALASEGRMGKKEIEMTV